MGSIVRGFPRLFTGWRESICRGHDRVVHGVPDPHKEDHQRHGLAGYAEYSDQEKGQLLSLIHI